MRNKRKLIFGVGINDSETPVYHNNKRDISYTIWVEMLRRCYSKKWTLRSPSYKGCLVCEEWHHYSNFKKWFNENYRFDLISLGIKINLDKDLLFDGNKIYSPDTCVFIPQKINGFLTNKQKTNTSGFIGVSFNNGCKKWRAKINNFDNGKTIHLGYFDNIEEAKQSYIQARLIESEKAKDLLRSLNYSEYIIDKIR